MEGSLSDQEDALDVVASVTESDRQLAEKIIYVWGLVNHGVPSPGKNIEPAMREALRTSSYTAMMRVRVRRAIEGNQAMYTDIKNIAHEVDNVCNGCTISLRCIAENYSTPSECLTLGIRRGVNGRRPVRVKPIHINGNRVTVASTHPAGIYEVNAQDLYV